MSQFTLWHNPSCSKSRAALKHLEESGREFQVFEYMKNLIDPVRLETVVGRLTNISEAVRTNSNEFQESPCELNSVGDVTTFLLENPQTLQRPILETEKEAVICRPPEKILEFI